LGISQLALGLIGCMFYGACFKSKLKLLLGGKLQNPSAPPWDFVLAISTILLEPEALNTRISIPDVSPDTLKFYINYGAGAE
jgi:hypothetical protein